MSRRFSDWDLDCKVYIGSISSRTTKDDIEALCQKCGPLRNVWIARNPPGFAFVEFEDKRDAEEAVTELDGARLCGQRIRVEMSHGKTRRDRSRSRDRRSRSPRLRLHYNTRQSTTFSHFSASFKPHKPLSTTLRAPVSNPQTTRHKSRLPPPATAASFSNPPTHTPPSSLTSSPDSTLLPVT